MHDVLGISLAQIWTDIFILRFFQGTSNRCWENNFKQAMAIILWYCYNSYFPSHMMLYRVIKKSLCTWRLQYRQSPHNWWVEDGHHRIHSECGPCYTEHGLWEHSL